MEKIRSHKELKVYQEAYQAALRIHQLTQSFPTEEKHALTNQIRRSSRSVCANLAEAWRKRRYPRNFISKLSDSEAEAAETQVWLDFPHSFEYINEAIHDELYDQFEHIIAMLIKMSQNSEKWTPKQQ
ncbi:four helix bundle protein [Sunxiuqinia sp. sy24]|uniref:four helix bundle protein n=1 Tax=Sunxiuqinia sp. sy24 TaxID=3461495 RepID=UPI004046271B